MFEFKEKAVLEKELAEEVALEKKKLEESKFRTISPYIIIQRLLKNDVIEEWVRKDIVKHQLILINAVINGFDVEE